MKNIFFIGCLFTSVFALGQTWYPVPNNFHNGYPVCFGVYQNKLFASGNFTIIGNNTVGRIADFNGNWYPLLNGLNGNANALTVFNNELYAGGNFVDANGIFNTYNIARWNGSNWSSSGNNAYQSDIYCLCVYNGDLYAGGIFTQMGGVSCNRIAKWNGSAWQSVGGGVTGSIPQVKAMTVINNKLYVAGLFNLAGGIPAYNIASWNGTQWDSVGSNGLNGGIANLITDTANNLLYASGGFNGSGTTQLWGIGKWDGNSWSAVGDDTATTDAGLVMYNNELYGCGYGSTVYHNTDTLWYLSKWNGTNWVHVSKFNATVEAMQVFSGNLYVSGTFTQIDTSQVKYIGCMGPNCLSVGMSGQEKLEQGVTVYPNPSDGNFTIEITNENFTNEEIEVEIYSLFGEKIFQAAFDKKNRSISISNTPAGLYFITLRSQNGIATKKVLIEN